MPKVTQKLEKHLERLNAEFDAARNKVYASLSNDHSFNECMEAASPAVKAAYQAAERVRFDFMLEMVYQRRAYFGDTSNYRVGTFNWYRGDETTRQAPKRTEELDMKKATYKAPRNAAERIAEAERAIECIRASMTGDNRFGSYGQSCRDSIARWQAVIDREKKV
jgi:hypothetical protein